MCLWGGGQTGVSVCVCGVGMRQVFVSVGWGSAKCVCVCGVGVRQVFVSVGWGSDRWWSLTCVCEMDVGSDTGVCVCGMGVIRVVVTDVCLWGGGETGVGH